MQGICSCMDRCTSRRVFYSTHKIEAHRVTSMKSNQHNRNQGEAVSPLLEVCMVLLSFFSGQGLLEMCATQFSQSNMVDTEVPSIAIEMLMADETRHVCNVVASSPSWLRAVREKLHKAYDNCKTMITGEASQAALSVPTSGSSGDPAPPRPAQQTKVPRAWPVLISRRSISWVDKSGLLGCMPIISPPTPMTSKASDFLYAALFTVGMAGTLTRAINTWMSVARFKVKLRSFDSAKENRKLMAYELQVIGGDVLHYVVWCSIHINHHLVGSAINALTLPEYNMVYSASLLCGVGCNFSSILDAIPRWVKTHITFSPYAAPDEAGLCFYTEPICKHFHTMSCSTGAAIHIYRLRAALREDNM